MEKTEPLEAEVAQTERIGLGDLVIVGLLAAATFALAKVWEFPGIYPAIWEDAAVAAYVRPASHVLAGYATAVMTYVYSTFGLASGAEMIRSAGHLLLAVIAICVYAVMREWLAFAMRMRPQLSRRRTLVMRLAAFIGAAAVVAADPVWSATQSLSDAAILYTLTLAAVEFFFLFLRKGTVKYAYLCSLVLGFLAAGTPFGFLLPVLFIAITHFVDKVMPDLVSPFFRPSVLQVAKWHMTFLFLAALAGGIALNCWTFIDHGGLAASGFLVGDLPLGYLMDYWHRIVSAADIGAWILWLAVCVLPFAVATIRFPESADEERFLSYAAGLIFLFCGVLVLAQSSFLPALRFWTYFPVDSQYLLSVGLFCCAATLALSVTVLGVDALCRDHRRLAVQFFGELAEGMEDDDAAARPRRRSVRAEDAAGSPPGTVVLRRLGLVVIPLVMLVVMFYNREQRTTREMLRIVDDFIAEAVRETAGVRHLFTDGNLDAVLELEAKRGGAELLCHSLMGAPDARGVYLRMRGLQDEEDRLSFKFDSAMGLRSWIRDKPARLGESAALMGFDLWKRDGKALPPMGGLLSRPAGFPDEAEQLRGIKAAHALADRVLSVAGRAGGMRGCADRAVRRAFDIVQWRLARMCLYRSEAYDMLGRAEDAVAEATRAKRLNDSNAIYLDMVASMEKRESLMMKALTPREGLQLALVRADFRMGKAYAETILAVEPDNPDANFAMGMFYLEQRQLSRAERYLLRCLIRKPNEPSVYNNLAMLQIELKKFDAARVNIEKALKIIPDSAAVLDTQRKLEEALGTRQKKAE